MNLLVNGAQAIGDRPDGQIRIRTRARDELAVIEVEDNGKGITEAELSASKSLGLLGMRERATAFGGGVEFAGAGGKGTRVTVVLPLESREN